MMTTDELREALANYAHEAWSGWMNYLLSKSTVNEDMTWTIPAESTERWYRQMSTPYHLLPEAEKESDRAEADKILELLPAQGAGVPVEVRRASKQLEYVITRLSREGYIVHDFVAYIAVVSDYLALLGAQEDSE